MDKYLNLGPFFDPNFMKYLYTGVQFELNSTVLNQNTLNLDIHDQRVTGFCLAEADCLQTAQTAFAKFWPCGPCMYCLPCLPNLPGLLVGWHKQQSFQTSLP